MLDKETKVGILVLSTAILAVGGVMCFGAPVYKVWERGKAGEAELAQADANRQIAIREAEARYESAKFEAKAIEEVRSALDATYLRYLWIQGLQRDTSDIIYIPTEAGLPILEAGRLNKDD